MKIIYLILFLSYSAYAQTNLFIYDLKAKSKPVRTMLVFSLLMIFCSAFGQEKTEFLYEVTVKKGINSFSTQFTLQFSDDEVAFISENVMKTDSMRSMGENATMNDPLNLTMVYSKNRKSSTTYFPLERYCYKIVSNEIPVWEILPDTKKVKNYTVQKAITTFGGRKWTAWFTNEIPIMEGPYKFRGLPGLIVEIEDEKRHFVFSLTEVKDKKNEVLNLETFIDKNQVKKPILISQQKYNELLLQEYTNPYAEFFNAPEGSWRIVTEGGRKVDTRKDLMGMVKDAQRVIRESYNPIELDKAVQYPVK